MASTSLIQAQQKLKQAGGSLFTVAELGKYLQHQPGNTLYKLIDRLVKNSVLKRLTSGKFSLVDNPVDDFALANFLVQPSYISLESALSRYGILAQFPFMITSVTNKRSQIISIEKDFEYTKLSTNLFWGYERAESYLIAKPEKALLDICYLASKGLRNPSIKELELEKINQSTWRQYKKHIKTAAFHSYIRQHHL